MQQTETIFLAKSEIKARDLDHRRKLNFSMKQYEAAFAKSQGQFSDRETARKRAKNVKWRAIENMDKYLEEFERRFTANGGQVIWAEDAEQARQEILKICRAKNAQMVVKSMSATTEEIRLNEFLEANNIKPVESAFGAYVQQLSGEPPYHIVSQAVHKSREEIAQLLHEKLQIKPGLPPGELTLAVRHALREKFQQAEVGITGANFILADIGGIAITENEGNARLATAFPSTHIVIAGIEKILPSINDLELFWPLLATYGSGETTAAFNSIITGPGRRTEVDGPAEMYVILLDNGRTNLLPDGDLRESLYCIRCGACLNASPVYKNIGGHAYGVPYSGPIGAVITPHLQGMKEYKHLSYASPLSGSATAACPVEINLRDLLLTNRKKAVEKHLYTQKEKMTWFLWKRAALSRKIMNLAGANTKNKILRRMFAQALGDRSILPEFAPKSFNQLWEEQKQP